MAAGEENLILFNELTEEEHRKLASKGGKASGEARRRKKAMKEQAEMLLGLAHTNATNKARMTELGIAEEDQDNQMAVLVALFGRALKGDARAVDKFMEMTGEKVMEVKVNSVTDERMEELNKMIEEARGK